MKPQIPYSLLCERPAMAVRKRFFMSEFVRNSLARLEQEIRKLVSPVPKDGRIGIFGTYQAARLVHSLLLQMGFRNLFFFNSETTGGTFRGYPLVNTCHPAVMEADWILTTSLARSVAQKDHLLSLGYPGKILCLPELKHLSTSFFRDLSTHETIGQLTGVHQQRPAFIIGNGPTLQQTDPRRIPRSFIRFAGNGIVRLDGFVPDYYFALEINAIRMWSQEIAALPSRRLFAAHVRKQLTGPAAAVRDKNNIFFPVCYEQEQTLTVHDWQARGFESGNTVVSPMIQFALLMGCNPLYLLGVDLTYKPTVGSYFCSNYHPADVRNYQETEIDGFQNRMLRSIARGAAACQGVGGEIYNCSPTRNIDFLEYRDFEEVLQDHSD